MLRSMRSMYLCAALSTVTSGLAISAPAQAARVMPSILVNGSAYDGGPLQTNMVYDFSISLNPDFSIFGFYRGPGHVCGGVYSSSSEYCAHDVFSSPIAGSAHINAVLLDGYNYIDDSFQHEDNLSFTIGSNVEGSNLLQFQEIFSDKRTDGAFFYHGSDPTIDGYSSTLGAYSLDLPNDFGNRPLGCVFSGSVEHGATYATTKFNTTANCSLNITFKNPVPPPPPPPAIPGVPEPSIWAMLLAGSGAIGAMIRRARRRDPVTA